jgi:hypothetical protein
VARLLTDHGINPWSKGVSSRRRAEVTGGGQVTEEHY